MRHLGLAALLFAGSLSCETYEPPPTATLDGLANGVLHDALAPLVLTFDQPVEPGTVDVEVAPFAIDSYGNLPDERPGGGSLDVLLRHTPTEDTNVVATFSADRTRLTLSPTSGPLPVGPSLVALVSPGVVSASTGAVLRYRERIPFSYGVSCGNAGSSRLASGAYFFLLQVNKPLGVELKVFAALEVDPKTGAFLGQFTAALRNSDPTRCSPACTGGTVCQLIPSEACVEMSTPPTSVFEWPDFVPRSTSPNGYTFEMTGCAVDEGDAGAVNIVTQPGVLTVASPAVRIEGLRFTAQFAPVAGGLVQASGSLTAEKTLLGTTNLGPGAGTLDALSIPAGRAPKLPQPGSIDAGADAAPGKDGGP